MDSIAGRRRSTRYLVPLADLFNQENGEENMNTQALQAPPKVCTRGRDFYALAIHLSLSVLCVSLEY